MKKLLIPFILFSALASAQIINPGGSGGVTTINGTAGAFTFNGTGVSCTTTTCTFSSSGGGDTITSPNSTLVVGGSAGATTLDVLALGTPASGAITNLTGTCTACTANSATAVPVGNITGLGSGVGTFLATPSSANLFSALTTKTGSGGSAVFATGPTISAPTISGHPTIEGVTSTGATGTGNFAFSASPTFTGTLNAAAFSPTGQILATEPTGSVWGSATGGAKGAGTINAVNLYVNGTAVGAGGSGTVSANSTTNAHALGVYTANGGSTTVVADTAGFTDGAGNATFPSVTIPNGTPAASTASVYITNAPYTAGSGTTNFPGLYYAVTGATAPTTLSTAGTMFGINAASGFTGDLINMFVNGGTHVWSVNYQGNQIVGGTLNVTGHVTVEGVTSTGATGTGKLVFDGSPTLTTAVLGSSTATTQSAGDNSTKVATTAYVDANTTVCNAGSFTAQTDGTTVTWAVASVKCANASLTFTVHSGSRTLNLTGLVTGGSYVLKLIQDATGGESLTGGTGCTWKQAGGGGSTFTLTATASAIDVLAFMYDGTNCLATLTKAFS